MVALDHGALWTTIASFVPRRHAEPLAMAAPVTRAASLQRVWDEEDVIARHWCLVPRSTSVGDRQHREELCIHLRERVGRTDRVAQALAVCAMSVPELTELTLNVLPPSSGSTTSKNARGAWDFKADVSRCHALRRLIIHGGVSLRTHDGNNVLAFLAALSGTLEVLDLSGAIGLRTIASMGAPWPNLRCLVLDNTDVDGAGLAQLSALTALETLRLAYCKRLVSLDALLGQPTTVHHLVLSASSITDDGLMPLGTVCPRLETLDISHCLQLTHLDGAASLRYLRTINASETRLTTSSLAVLGAGLAMSLQSLDLTGCTTVDSIAALVGTNNTAALTSLNLSGTPISNVGLLPVRQLNHLKELRLFRCHSVSDTAAIAECVHLQVLLMGGCTALTTAGAAPLARCGGMSSLTHLDLSGCALVDADMLTRVVQNCPSLTDVVLKGTQADNGTVQALAGIEALTSLDLTHCRNVTDVRSLLRLDDRPLPRAGDNTDNVDDFASSANGHAALRVLNLCGTSLTLDGVHGLEEVGTLEALDVSMCPSVAEWDAADIMRARLTSFRIDRN